jgi:intracellular septation protein A
LNIELITLTLIPLLLFVFVEWRYGPKAGAIAAVTTAVLGGIWWYFRFGAFDETLLVEILILTILSLITVRLNDSRYVKFQPVIVGVLFAGYCTVLHIWFEPVLVRWMPLMEPMVPQLGILKQNPNWTQCLGESSWGIVFSLLVHGFLVGWAALRHSSLLWILARIMIYPLMIMPAIWFRICL